MKWKGFFCVFEWWGILVSNPKTSKQCMHPSLFSSLQKGLICRRASMLWETLIPCLCRLETRVCTQTEEERTQREAENHADTTWSKPHQIRKKTAQRRFRSKKLFIMECKSLHREEKGKELCIASQLHRIWWQVGVKFSKISTTFILVYRATSCYSIRQFNSHW